MPEAGLFDEPLSVSHRRGSDAFPIGWVHHQVTMPRRAGVDAVAGAVQLLRPGIAPDEGLPLAAAVRHWCGEDIGQLNLRSATATDLVSEGQLVLRLGDLELHDPHLVELPGCPLVVVSDDTPLLWVEATRHRGADVPKAGWVPYGQCVVRWLDRDSSQPVAHAMNMTGLGAARDREAAIEQACEDLIAQDAVMTWWLHGAGRPLPLVPLDGDLAEAWDQSPLELRLRVLTSPTGIRTVLAVVLDPELDVATLSPAAGFDAESRAAARALWQHAVAHDLLSRDGGLHQSRAPGLMAYRADRGYIDEAGPGLRRALDPLANVQLGLDPAVLTRVDERTIGLAPRPYDADETDGAFEALLATGRDVWVVDLTTSDVAAAGWHCVRILASGLARIPVAAFPLDPTGSTADAARQIGFPSAGAEPFPYPGW